MCLCANILAAAAYWTPWLVLVKWLNPSDLGFVPLRLRFTLAGLTFFFFFASAGVGA
ncbi:hypothetical protein C8R45DRAFT_1088909 [Mycena sanguinolenta]|nr:hypothetical protein C8R45DRAFT_1088909 [Mycena sanguinolenta]